MFFASSFTRDISDLAHEMSAHLGAPIPKIARAVAGSAGFIEKLEVGADCTTAEYEAAIVWFEHNWPQDLLWPIGVYRPSRVSRHISRLHAPLDKKLGGLDGRSGEFLARLSRLPVWKSGRRPVWWGNIELREFLTASHRQRTLKDTMAEANARFGEGSTSISSIQRYWAFLDKALAEEGVA